MVGVTCEHVFVTGLDNCKQIAIVCLGKSSGSSALRVCVWRDIEQDFQFVCVCVMVSVYKVYVLY